MSTHLERLKDLFLPEEIEFRINQAGEKQGGGVWAKALAYVTNRAMQDRLDLVCGPENWRNEFREWQGEGVLCGLSIRVGGEWVTKWDGAPNTGFESIKGGLSDAMKRAAYQWGIGRYLYKLPESWAITSTDKQQGDGWHYAKTKGGTVYYWETPQLPEWALPAGYKKPEAPKRPATKKQPTKAEQAKKQASCEDMADELRKKMAKVKTIEELDGLAKQFKAITWPEDIADALKVYGDETRARILGKDDDDIPF